ncbi:MAG: polysaccharide deacetylase family protein [Simkaniaceae bacterium]
MLRSHNRYPYSAIPNRLIYEWPNGRRLAIFFGISLECFSFGVGTGAQLRPNNDIADVVNFSWRDYGLRVGAWRLLELFKELHIPVSVLVNSEMYDYAPELVKEFHKQGSEIIAHGRTNSERQGNLNEAEENVLIRDVTQRITLAQGSRPYGWLGPWVSETMITPDLLQEHGYHFLLDWCFDDQPIWLRTRNGKILAIPVCQELVDLSAILVYRRGAAEYAQMIMDQFDEMLKQSEKQPLVLGIGLHPFIVGQPFRFKHLRRALMHISSHREQIFLTQPGKIYEFIYHSPYGK